MHYFQHKCALFQFLCTNVHYSNFFAQMCTASCLWYLNQRRKQLIRVQNWLLSAIRQKFKLIINNSSKACIWLIWIGTNHCECQLTVRIKMGVFIRELDWKTSLQLIRLAAMKGSISEFWFISWTSVFKSIDFLWSTAKQNSNAYLSSAVSVY